MACQKITMKKLLLLFTLCFIANCASAQLPDGTIAPNWSLPDINGTPHNLYTDYLDLDKHVLLDFSATWCPPCWSYHNGGAMKTFYNTSGPGGTNVAMVFMMEADEDTNTNCLYGPTGCNDSTMGDWVTGTPYPIVDAPTAQLRQSYSISYWPTIYMVNGYDNRIFETGQVSATGFANWMQSFELQVASSNIIQQDCQNFGGVELTPTGGFGNLSYSWSNGATTQNNYGLEGGDYYVTITDNNGYFIERGPFTVTIDNTNGDFGITPSILENVSCTGYNNGQITITTNNSNVTYLWSNGSTTSSAFGLAPGSHSVIVSNDLGCVDSEIFTITEPPLLNGVIGSTNPSCDNNDGQVVLTGTGGTAPYSYTLDGIPSSDGIFTDLAPSVYVALVEDFNGCFFTDVVELIGDPIPTAMTAVPDVLDCNVTEVLLDATGSTGGTNVSYEWLDEAGNVIATSLTTMVDVSGDYTFKVIDNLGCSSESVVSVTEDLTAPTISTNNETITCTSSTVQLCATVSNDATSNYWIVNGQQVDQNCITVESPGDYEAFAIGANGCQNSSVSTVIVDTNIPTADIEDVDILTCVNTTQIVTANLSGNLNDFTINWTTDDGNIVAVNNPLEIEVDQPGVYEMSVVDNNSGCELIQDVLVEEFINTPVSDFSAVNDDDFLHMEDLSDGDPSSWTWKVDGAVVSNASMYSFPLVGAGQHTVCLEIENECGTNESCKSVSIVDPLMLGVDVTHVSCFGGSNGNIVVSPTGGVAPHSIEVSADNGYTSVDEFELSNLAAGIYTIEVRDSETRVETIQIEVTQNDQIDISSTTINLACNGIAEGEIELNVSGGSGNFEYEWSNGNTTANPTDLEAGTYSVVVTDDLDCMSEEEFELTEPDAIVQQGAIQDVSCFGDANGSISMSVSGGTGVLELDWSGDLEGLINTNLPAGVYDLVVNDENGCESAASYEVTQPEQIESTASIQDVSCFGDSNGSISLDIVGGTGSYEINWDNGGLGLEISDLSAGSYDAVITDENDCAHDVTYEVTQPDQLVVVLDNVEDDLGGQGVGSIDITVSGGVMPYSYEWSNGSTDEDPGNLTAGDYTVVVYDANDCELLSDTYTVEFVSSVNNLESLLSFDVFPNPVRDQLNVKMEFDQAVTGKIELRDYSGKLFFTSQIENERIFSKLLELDQVAAGMYFLEIKTNEGSALRRISVVK